ncbi:hypothetical protein PVK06_027983 [Gossypium arboreum]|uniref:Uncharacterized protein n=1 Tax=Gossypium arboreum TaxID=29729 RepID=A0ABR0P1Q7_GOSAR|nr:hypothetical protein PVK06_027983 [Gossypium arboreum]
MENTYRLVAVEDGDAAEGTLDGYVADARGEGDGGDGLRCTGRRRWRGWFAMHGEKVMEEMGCNAQGDLGISEFIEIGISELGQTRGKGVSLIR